MGKLTFNTEKLSKKFLFKSKKKTISESFLDFDPEIIQKDYEVQIFLDDKCKIVVAESDTSTIDTIDNLQIVSHGDGGVILRNAECFITVEWGIENDYNVQRVLISFPQNDSKVVYS